MAKAESFSQTEKNNQQINVLDFYEVFFGKS